MMSDEITTDSSHEHKWQESIGDWFCKCGARRMNEAVTPIREKPEYVSSCPGCRTSVWYVRLDGINNNWENIIGIECVDCGFFIPWDTEE